MEKNLITTWNIDPAHSRIGFVIKHMGIADVSGYFSNFEVKTEHIESDYSDINVQIAIEANSINTGIDMRDNHLRSADFFDVAKYPEIFFTSTKVEKTDNTHGKLYGDLTIRGITKNIGLDIVHFGTVINPMTEQETAGFKITGVISREDFTLGTSFGANFISDKVKIVVDAEFSPEK